MTRAGRGLIAATMTAGLLVASAIPAMAGDVASANGSVVGDWTTRTQGVKQTVTFDKKGRVFGDSGCNRFTGGYTVSGDRITIGPLASTMMFCEGKMDAEAAFLNKLQNVVSYQATDVKLRLYTQKDLMVLRAA
jgi:heat shock protein HslJ